MHRVIKDILPGDFVYYEGLDNDFVLEEGKERIRNYGVEVIRVLNYSRTMDLLLPGANPVRTISLDLYRYTLIPSQTCPKKGRYGKRVWSECEIYYGINIHGSADPDPLRQLAFAILQGDPIALDAARDIITGAR